MTALKELCKLRRYLLQNQFLAACLQDLSLLECSETLLSVDIGIVIENPTKSDCRIRMGKALLPLVGTGDNINLYFSKLLTRILDDTRSTGREEFLDLVWENAEKLKNHFGTSMIEKLAEKYPKYLEIKILDVFDNVLKNGVTTEDVWNIEEMLIKLCAESSLIFSLVCSIMNEILSSVRNGAFIECLIVIRKFVFTVSLICTRNGTHIIDLYPQQYRNLWYLMNFMNIVNSDCTLGLEKCVEDITNVIIQNVNKTLKEKPHEVIALISHLGAWRKMNLK